MRIKRVPKRLEGETREGRSPLPRWLVFAVSLFALIAVQSSFVRSAELAQGEFKARIKGLELWYVVSGKDPVCIIPSTGWGPSTDISLIPLEEGSLSLFPYFVGLYGTGGGPFEDAPGDFERIESWMVDEHRNV